MKSMPFLPPPRPVFALGFLLLFTGCATTPPPDTLPEGLVRVKDTEADLVYVRPGIDFAAYQQFYLLEPTIAFRADWKDDMLFPGGGMPPRVDSSDIERMIAMGKKLLAEQFDAEMTKGGYTLVKAAGPHVLGVKASIVDLYVDAPDPNDLAGTLGRTYSKESGAATLEIELYDSLSGQLLARAHDYKDNSNDGWSWRFHRTQQSNIADARAAFGAWAEMLVNGLKRAKAAKVPPAPARK